MTDALIVLVTVGARAEGERLADALVGESLAACVNIVGPVRSIYRWHGEICRDEEHLLLIKTAPARYAELEARVRALHSYDVPEVIALPIERGSEPYLQWLIGNVGP
ncbi:MAG: divalent-cation tolerance protein CutA [Candidatus Binatia bacterium]